MNDADKNLLDFFHDIGNIESYKQNSQKISDFCDKCYAIIRYKTYSNINLQDQNGNTYLHHISNRSNWTWFIKLLNLGADPTIVNNKGFNAFQVCPNTSSIFNFWRITQISNLDSFISDWDKKTENFAPNFKQFLFEGHLANNNSKFNSIEDALNFLKISGLDTNLNKIRIVGVSINIGIEEKFDWFESRYDTPEYNTEFFSKLMRSLPLIEDKERYYEKFNKFLDKEIIQNDEFNKVAKDIVSDTKDGSNDKIFRCLVKSMIKQGFNFDIEIGYKKDNLMELIRQNNFTHQIFLDETLKSNSNQKKTMKI